ncbi:MAG: C4-dicarboxylate ABC transporter permease [Burkholderiales bacterium RIFCSPHIGHO2_12_FULL_69_20]|nr:MAG: C4-dicarboxylate ABC transporter permease [Burkholderiales bacterium RIFCSPHIGHO2_12_FULL_69_20]
MTGALILLGLVALLLALRQPLLVILLAAVAVVHIVWGKGQLDYIIEDMWISLDKELILSIPMFILCGGVMTKGSTARRLIGVAAALTGHLPGGLAVACVLSCGVFAAISGSSIVTMLAIGTVMLPAMTGAGYPNRFALGAIMAGGTLGIIIPPSIPLILYGLVTETSITDLFVAGIGPGLLLLGAFAVYSMWVNRKLPRQRFDGHRLRVAMREGIWALLMPVILLGGIYTGYFSAIEAAAVSLVYALVVETFIHREFKLRHFYDVVLDASKLGGTLFPLLAVALSLNLVLTEHQVPGMMVEMMKGVTDSPLLFMLIVNLLLLIVGCLMTSGEAILILGPLLAPLAVAYGFDPVMFGIIMIVNLEIGFLTPPVGLNLLVAMSTFKQKFGELVLAATPFIVLMLGCLALIAWQPWISMGLVGR